MTHRIVLTVAVVGLLIGLITYSQYRPAENRVSGFIEADEIRVGSRLGGRVLSVHVQEGQRVKAGQVLVQLEPYDLLEREQEAIKQLAAREAEYQRMTAGLRPEEIAQAKARYEQSKARYDLLAAGPRPEEIKAAQASLELALSDQVLAKQNDERARQLIAQQAISQAEFDAAREKHSAATAMVQVRKEELALLQAGTREEELREAKARVDEAEQAWKLAERGYRVEDVDQAEAARDAAQANLDVVRRQKQELSIECPVDGAIEALDLQKGDLTPAGGPVLSVIDDHELWVRAYVPLNRVGLKIGDVLRVAVDGLPGESLRGEVAFIARQAEFTPSNAQTPDERAKQVFRIKVVIKSDSESPRPTSLRPGMTADVWLDPLDESP